MPLLDLTCHCCSKPFQAPERKLKASKTGILHCSRPCTARCKELNRRTAWFTCEQCERIYSPNDSADVGELKSQRFCSRECKRAFQTENGHVYRERSDTGTRRAEWVDVPCHGCGDLVSRRETDVREFVFCSRGCYRARGGSAGKGRAKHKRTTDRTFVTRDWGTVNARVNGDGYVDLYIPEHPWAKASTRTILAHRLVMEESLGRHLTSDELVHHKDGDKINNDISNLELCRYYQPPGQRVEDQVAQARAVIARYGHLFPETEASSADLGLASDSGAR